MLELREFVTDEDLRPAVSFESAEPGQALVVDDVNIGLGPGCFFFVRAVQ